MFKIKCFALPMPMPDIDELIFGSEIKTVPSER